MSEDGIDWDATQARPAEPTGPQALPARYEGWCRECSGDIALGDMIRMTDDGAVHNECWTPALMVAQRDPRKVDEFGMVAGPTGPVCDTCWLTHPEGACDR